MKEVFFFFCSLVGEIDAIDAKFSSNNFPSPAEGALGVRCSGHPLVSLDHMRFFAPGLAGWTMRDKKWGKKRAEELT